MGPNGRLARVPAFKSDTDTSSGYPIGSPAIEPSIMNHAPATPAFTVADVMLYNTTHHSHGIGFYESSSLPGIDKIEFLTAQEFKARVPGASLGGVPTETLLCYVQYSGTFIFTPHRSAPVTNHHAMEVFDAQSGNLLAFGTSP